MRKLLAVAACIISSYLPAQSLQQIESQKVVLPNGWALTPVGRSLKLGDLPLNIAVSRSKKLIAVTNNGQSVQSLQLIDPVGEKVIDSVVVAKSWYGLVFSGDEKKLYASGGHDNWILEYGIEGNKLVLRDSIKLGKKWPNRIGPAGIAIDDARQLLYVVTRDDHKLYTIDLATKQVRQTFDWGARPTAVYYRRIIRNSISVAGVVINCMCTIRRKKILQRKYLWVTTPMNFA
jgi:DNA-binding beta-propeller fold protein YncE